VLLDPGEALVGGQLPLDIVAAGAEAPQPVLGQRVDGQPGPQHDPVRGRLAGGDTEGER
jgi:hypothetical protein